MQYVNLGKSALSPIDKGTLLPYFTMVIGSTQRKLEGKTKKGSILQQQVLTSKERNVMPLVWLVSLTLDSLRLLGLMYYGITVGSEDPDGGLEQ